MDPLANLRDIHLPTMPGFWPPAIGWWLLVIATIITVSLIIFRIYKYWKDNRYRREAIREINQLLIEYNRGWSTSQYIVDLQYLLKRVALTCYPRTDVAHLTGESWVAFLDQTSRSHDFSMGKGQSLIDGHYLKDPDIDVEALHKCSINWIKHHRKEARYD